MAKRRKKSPRGLPAKGRLREMADRLWSKAVKSDWGEQCAICRSRTHLNAHHLIPRQHASRRYDMRNGICLCAHCHQFCPDNSPHQNAGGFVLWLERHHQTLAEWYFSTAEDGFYRELNGVKNVQWYVDIIQSLRQYVEDDQFRSIVGVRFARWLEDHE